MAFTAGRRPSTRACGINQAMASITITPALFASAPNFVTMSRSFARLARVRFTGRTRPSLPRSSGGPLTASQSTAPMLLLMAAFGECGRAFACAASRLADRCRSGLFPSTRGFLYNLRLISTDRLSLFSSSSAATSKTMSSWLASAIWTYITVVSHRLLRTPKTFMPTSLYPRQRRHHPYLPRPARSAALAWRVGPCLCTP